MQFGRTTDFTVANAISGSGDLIKTNGAVMTLTGANSYGATIINAGTLRVGNSGTQGSLGTGGVTNNAALAFNRSDTVTVSNIISGTGTLTQAGSGELRIAGVNSFTGDTTVATGRLSLTETGSLATSASIVVRAGAVFDISAVLAQASIRNLDNAGTVELGGKSLLLAAQVDAVEGTINGSAGIDEFKVEIDPLRAACRSKPRCSPRGRMASTGFP